MEPPGRFGPGIEVPAAIHQGQLDSSVPYMAARDAVVVEQQRAAKVHRLGLLNAQSPGKGVEDFARAFEWRRAAMPSHSVLLPASRRQRAPSPIAVG